MSDIDDDITNDVNAKNSNENTESALSHGSNQNETSPNVTSTSGSTNEIAAPLSVVIPDGNPHTIVVGPCSPSDGGQSPKSERSHPDGETKDTEHQHPVTTVATQPKLESDPESNEHTDKAENLTINVVPNDIENNNATKAGPEIKEEQEDATVKSEQPRTPSPSLRPMPLAQPPVPGPQHPGHLLLASTAIKDHLFSDLPTRSLPPTFLASHHDPIFSLQAADHRARHSFPVPFSL